MTPFRTPHPVVAIAVVSAFVVLCVLGAWQLRRLVWKEGVIAAIETNLAATPTVLPADPPEFLHVRLEGEFIVQEYYLGGKYHGQDLGYDVLSPMRLRDGRVVLVDRGWIAVKEREDAQASALRRVQGETQVHGIVRHPAPKRWFNPANDAVKNIWFWYDIPALRVQSGLELTPFYVERLASSHDAKRPIPLSGKIAIRNDHLQYALTWFGLAVSLLVMFGIAHWKRDARV